MKPWLVVSVSRHEWIVLVGWACWAGLRCAAIVVLYINSRLQQEFHSPPIHPGGNVSLSRIADRLKNT